MDFEGILVILNKFYGVFDEIMRVLVSYQNTCKTRAKYVFCTYPKFMRTRGVDFRTRGVFSRTKTRTKYVLLVFPGMSIFDHF